jgi:hypothetical protein
VAIANKVPAYYAMNLFRYRAPLPHQQLNGLTLKKKNRAAGTQSSGPYQCDLPP